VHTDEAQSWNEVDDWISDRGWARAPHEPRATVVYRGVSVTGRRLESGLLRRGEDYAQRERFLLGAFRRYAYRQGRTDWSDWEWLALAQHYGLPTRLIDFTFSPLIALHFATVSNAGEAGQLWAVDYQQVHEKLPEQLSDPLRQGRSSLFGTEQLAAAAWRLSDFDRMGADGHFAVFWEPPALEERIVNQSAVFCAMSSPTARFDDWLDAHSDAGRVLRLSEEAKAEARERLDHAGITERLLFPDLSGLAAWIARYYA
jgi:FRG domain